MLVNFETDISKQALKYMTIQGLTGPNTLSPTWKFVITYEKIFIENFIHGMF